MFRYIFQILYTICIAVLQKTVADIAPGKFLFQLLESKIESPKLDSSLKQLFTRKAMFPKLVHQPHGNTFHSRYTLIVFRMC